MRRYRMWPDDYEALPCYDDAFKLPVIDGFYTLTGPATEPK